MKLSVVVPCYNEGKSINEFYEKLKSELDEKKISHEIIMVNDGSEDDTNDFLISLNEKDKNVKIAKNTVFVF